MKLVIDIGNTRLKAALADGDRLRPLPAFATSASLDAATWAAIPDVDAIWIASVASDAINESVQRSLHRFDVSPRFVTSSAAACGVRNAYAEPQRLGVDRFLALVAMRAVNANDAIVIASCGTALTLDAMTADGRHLGGLIAPSPALMQAALRGGTAKLADTRASNVVEFASDTDTAVSSGTWLAAVSLVERFVAQTAQRVDGEPRLVVGGGDAATLGALLGIGHRIEPDLVMRGLSIYATAHP
jgi:type III pantothenate kinase